MPLLFVPSNQPFRIVKAVVFLFLTNVLLGGPLGLLVAQGALRDHPLSSMGAGVVLANVATYGVTRALYRRAVRAASGACSLGDFLDDMLYVLLGIEAGFPLGILVAVTSWNKHAAGNFHSHDVWFLAFGVVTLALAAHSTVRLVHFLRKTRANPV